MKFETCFGQRGRYHKLTNRGKTLYLDDEQLRLFVKLSTEALSTPVGAVYVDQR
jgi:hypothetical protein